MIQRSWSKAGLAENHIKSLSRSISLRSIFVLLHESSGDKVPWYEREWVGGTYLCRTALSCPLVTKIFWTIFFFFKSKYDTYACKSYFRRTALLSIGHQHILNQFLSSNQITTHTHANHICVGQPSPVHWSYFGQFFLNLNKTHTYASYLRRTPLLSPKCVRPNSFLKIKYTHTCNAYNTCIWQPSCPLVTKIFWRWVRYNKVHVSRWSGWFVCKRGFVAWVVLSCVSCIEMRNLILLHWYCRDDPEWLL